MKSLCAKCFASNVEVFLDSDGLATCERCKK
jgi:hypothetical protein